MYKASDTIPFIWWQVLLINIITFVVSFLILLIPSLLVKR